MKDNMTKSKLWWKRGSAFKGSKKSGLVGDGPVEDPTSLRSVTYAKVIDVLCEGEIEGLVDGAKSIYLDSVPLENADGTPNFSGYSWEIKEGLPIQKPIDDFSAQQKEIGVNRVVTESDPVVRIITDTEVEAVRVTVEVPNLSLFNDNGDLTATTVEYSIEIASNVSNVTNPSDTDSTFTTYINDVIRGKTTSPFQRSKLINLEGYTFPVAIRVVRVTPDSENSKLNNKIAWASYTEIVYESLAYPLTAYAGVKVDSRYFNSIPTRGYHLKLTKVKVPSNYDPETRVYTGDWDGTFSEPLWTDNPAWCYYDLISNARYGLSDILFDSENTDSLIDKWQLYHIGKYCDELVPDGSGGTEPRFTCNIYLQTREDAYSVLRSMASIFRGISYWAGSSLHTVQDKPAEPVAIFSTANVEDGLFSYEGTGLKARHTAALVSWNDPTLLYDKQVEYIEDTESINKYGYRPLEITAIGCTSRGQANRVGKWALLTEKVETQGVAFTTGLDASGLYPGAIIQVQDEHKAGKRYSGRVTAATSTTITVDNMPALNNNPDKYTLYYQSGRSLQEDVTGTTKVSESLSLPRLDQAEVLSVLGNVITLASPITDIPDIMSVWVLESTAERSQLFRVLGIQDSGDNTYGINAIQFEPNKFDTIENDIDFEAQKTLSVSTIPAAIEGLQVLEEVLLVPTGIRSNLYINWDFSSTSTRYNLEVSRDGGAWETKGPVEGTSFTMQDVVVGSTYKVRIKAVGPFGALSPTYRYAEILVLGKNFPPENVANFSILRGREVLSLTWDHTGDTDRSFYIVKRINRALVEGEDLEALWDSLTLYVSSSNLSANGIIADRVYHNTLTTDLVVEGTYTYLIKAVDAYGLESETVSTTTLAVPAPSSVKGFAVIQNSNRIEMVWSPNSEEGIVGYEIREGDSWTNSKRVAEVSGNRHTITYGSYGSSRNFLIKAIVSPGIYSLRATSANTSVVQISGFNSVFSYVEDSDPSWGGRVFPYQAWTENTDGALVTANTAYSEYVFELTLSQSYTAQTTVELNASLFSPDTETWGTATFTWDSEEATRTWEVSPDDLAKPDLEVSISEFTGALESTEYDVWDYNGSYNSFNTIAPIDNSNSLLSLGGRYLSGAMLYGYLGKVATLSYDVEIPKSFTWSSWISLDNRGTTITTDSRQLLYLSNSTTGDWLRLEQVDKISTSCLRLSTSSGLWEELPFTVSPNPSLGSGFGDSLFIAISQSVNELKIYASNVILDVSSFGEYTHARTTSGYTNLRIT